jgi:Tol biopolymer transport system component
MNPRRVDFIELSRLIIRMCDGNATPEEFEQLEHRLRDDAQAQAFYREQIALQVHLSWICASVSAFENGHGPALTLCRALTPGGARKIDGTSTIKPAVRNRWTLRACMAAAVAASLVLAVWLFRPRPAAHNDAVIAHLVELNGESKIVTNSGETAIAAVGQEIRAGQTVRTGAEESFAVIEFFDQTRLELGANTNVQLSQNPAADGAGRGKKVTFTTGTLRVDVTPQPQGQPMVVSTPQAEIRGQESGFLLSAIDPQATRIDLEEGKVALTHPAGGQTVEVEAGSYALACSDREGVTIQPLPQSLTEPRAIVAQDSYRYIAYLPDGSLLMPASKEIVIWDKAGVERRVPNRVPGFRNRRSACSRDGKLLAVSDANGQVSIWDLMRLEEVRILETQAGEVHLALSPDESCLAIACNPKVSKSGEIRLWDIGSGTLRQVVEIEDRMVHRLAFSPDGRWLAAGTGKAGPREQSIRLFDPSTGRQLGTLPTQVRHVMHLTFSADSRWLGCLNEDGTVQVWDMTTQTMQWVFRGGRQFECLAFSPDGRFLAAGDTSGRVWLWNVVSGAESLVIKVSNKWMWGLAFSPDGRTLATTGHSSPLLLWDVGRLSNQE